MKGALETNCKNKKVLVVDDEDSILSSLRRVLESDGFEVEVTSDGKSALQMAGLEKFDTIISDIHMPNSPINGIELLHYVKNKIHTPVILMTGFASLSETDKGDKLGASAFLPKPFKREEIIKAVRVCCGLPEEDESSPEDIPQEYWKLNIDEFVSGSQIKYDIYVCLAEDKYIKVAHQGQDLSLDRIKSYKSKGINFLYLKKEDFQHYLAFNLELTKIVRISKRVSKAKKLNLVKHTTDLVLQNLFLKDLDRSSFEKAMEIIDGTVSLLVESEDYFEMIDSLNSSGDTLYSHSLGVSLYSVLIARELGWDSSITLFKVAIAGLLHDIGKKEIDPAILNKPRHALTPEQVLLYESHPLRGMEILGHIPGISSEILQIVLQHHENCSGRGYPSALKKNQINPIARLIAVADEFCKLVFVTPGSVAIPPQEALNRLNLLYKEILDPTYLAALTSLLESRAKKV